MIKKIVLAPDSFKGTMTSFQICQLMESVIHRQLPQVEVTSIPIADGGEGTVDCFLMSTKGQKKQIVVKDPYFQDMAAFYGLIDGGQTAVIEVAACIGLPLVELKMNPALTTSFGVGQMMMDAINSGCRNIILGLGGSCTNDAGCGCLAALGVKFFDKDINTFIPTGGTLKKIQRIDLSELSPDLLRCHVRIMCDVSNPLYGEQGAAFVFSPQKGADAEMVIELDDQLRYFACILEETLDRRVHHIPGAGAAGGMGAGLQILPNVTISSGIETVIDTIGLRTILENADLVLTGEGRFDEQSLNGKVVIGIAKVAKEIGVPTIAIVGDIGDNIELAYEMGLNSIFSINKKAIPFELAKQHCTSDLQSIVDNLFRLIRVLSADD